MHAAGRAGEHEDDLRLPGEEPGPPRAPERRGLAHAAWLALLLLAPLSLVPVALLLEPDPRGHGTHEQLGLEPCAALERWGLPCPGCGVTTALTLGARGRLGAALAVQPFGFLMVLALPFGALWALVQHARGRDLARELARRRRAALTFLAAALLLAWVYRLVSFA